MLLRFAESQRKKAGRHGGDILLSRWPVSPRSDMRGAKEQNCFKWSGGQRSESRRDSARRAQPEEVGRVRQKRVRQRYSAQKTEPDILIARAILDLGALKRFRNAADADKPG